MDEGIPDLGAKRKGRIFVCFGDARPTDFISWLEPIHEEFNELSALAESHGLDFESGQEIGVISGYDELVFLEACGLEFDWVDWTGSLISGSVCSGWIQAGTVREVKARAREILDYARNKIDPAVREDLLGEAEKIQPLDAFVEQLTTDIGELRERNADLQALLSRRDRSFKKVEALLSFVPLARDPLMTEQSSLPEDLIAAYQSTTYVTDHTPVGQVSLRPGERSQEMDALFAHHKLAREHRRAAFITAYNPMSVDFPRQLNEERHRKLMRDVRDLGCVFHVGAGVGEDHAEWEPEKSVLIINISCEAAIPLGVKYQQNAIVFVGSDLIPHVLLFR